MESASTGPPPPCLPCVRCLPSRSPSARAQARTVLPPSAHRLHPASQPDPTITPRSSSRTPQRSPASTHPSTRSRPHACAHAHENTPTHAPASHAYTFASRTRTPAHARAPALHTHSSTSEDSGICRRVDLRPMRYGSRGGTTGVGGAGSGVVGEVGRDRGGGRAGAGRGFRCWHSRISEKKLRRTVHFSLENFTK